MLGARYRIRVSDFDAWVDRGRVAPAAASVEPRPPAAPRGGPGSYEALVRIEAEAA